MPDRHEALSKGKEYCIVRGDRGVVGFELDLEHVSGG